MVLMYQGCFIHSLWLFSCFVIMTKMAINIPLQVFFSFLWIQVFRWFGQIQRSMSPDLRGRRIFSLVTSCLIVFQKACNVFHHLTKWIKLPDIPPSQYLVLLWDFDHSCPCAVVSHCYFNFQFPEDICGASLHILICHLCTFFSEVSLKVSDPVFNWLFVNLVWVLRVLCIFWITVVFFCYIFVHAKYIFFEIP